MRVVAPFAGSAETVSTPLAPTVRLLAWMVDAESSSSTPLTTFNVITPVESSRPR